MSRLSWNNAGSLIVLFCLLVSVDTWIGATGASDPFQIDLFGKPFSFMAGARGVAIVLSVAYAVRQLGKLRWSGKDKTLRRLLINGVVGMLLIETAVISPFTFSTTIDTPLAKSLESIWNPLRYIWATLASGMTLLAVGLAAVSSLAEKPERQPRKERNVQLHQTNRRSPRKNSK